MSIAWCHGADKYLLASSCKPSDRVEHCSPHHVTRGRDTLEVRRCHARHLRAQVRDLAAGLHHLLRRTSLSSLQSYSDVNTRA